MQLPTGTSTTGHHFSLSSQVPGASAVGARTLVLPPDDRLPPLLLLQELCLHLQSVSVCLLLRIDCSGEPRGGGGALHGGSEVAYTEVEM